ncbi:hypothetical protein CHH80_10945 [Bacillus sp. 7504-2]|nr:hypothetical protein CHH80_10945 [Bacillus sp. 7504-2]
MGYIRHNAIVVTGYSYPEAQKKFEKVYSKANELFEGLVSNIIPALTNGYQSFLIAPDGSKEGWDLSDEYDAKRKEFADFVDSMAYGDGSNPIQFVDIAFDEQHIGEVDRTNKERPDEE